MRLNLIPKPFWNMPTMVDDDEDLWLSNFSGGSGVSVSEDDSHVYVTASTPGLEEKDIEVTFDKGTLWIKGEKQEVEEDKKRKFYRRAESSFSYRIAVPGDLDLSKDPEATYKNGVMTISFVKSPQSQPKKIAFKSSN